MGLLDSPFSFHEKKGLWIVWVLSLILSVYLMILIYRFSAANAIESSGLSQGLSYRIIRFLLRYLPGEISENGILEMAEWIETPIRKLAHFSEYTCLGLLLQFHMYSVWNLNLHSLNQRKVRKDLYMTGVLFCVIYAISDEIHQYFVPGRACRIYDVCIDTFGAIFGLILFWLIFRRLLDGIFGKGYNQKK